MIVIVGSVTDCGISAGSESGMDLRVMIIVGNEHTRQNIVIELITWYGLNVMMPFLSEYISEIQSDTKIWFS